MGALKGCLAVLGLSVVIVIGGVAGLVLLGLVGGGEAGPAKTYEAWYDVKGGCRSASVTLANASGGTEQRACPVRSGPNTGAAGRRRYQQLSASERCACSRTATRRPRPPSASPSRKRRYPSSRTSHNALPPTQPPRPSGRNLRRRVPALAFMKAIPARGRGRGSVLRAVKPFCEKFISGGVGRRGAPAIVWARDFPGGRLPWQFCVFSAAERRSRWAKRMCGR